VLDSLNASNTFENHELERQPVTKTQGYWDSQYGRARPHDQAKSDSIPGPFEGIREATPPYRFQWEETLETLRQRADNDDSDPHDGYSLSYVNPATGKPPLFPTMSFRAQLLQEATDPHFHNATDVYFVIEGEGATHVDDEALEWSQWDIFVVPPDATHHHEPDDEAILLGITDRPVFEAFNFYAEARPS
jgi:gentisate 1,2-dioxygenase